MSSIKYGILGGDYRYKILCTLLENDGYSVEVYGSDIMQDTVADIEELLAFADVLIAPIPCSKDGRNVNIEGSTLEIPRLISLMDKYGCRVMTGGVINSLIKTEAQARDIRVYDFFDMEEVAVLNAIPTAEGAVQTAMEESDRTLFGSSVLVLGCGRCGKVLANTLKGIGANVSVSYRKESDRAYITAYGLTAIPFKELVSYAGGYSFIFNTIPAPVINREILRRVKRDCVIIDIAQAPGGTDFGYARDLNIKALYCPGLPGRVAPYTAAEVLKGALIGVSMYGRQ